MTIGIVGLGYGDGLLRSLGNRDTGIARLMVNNTPAPLIGRMSMDTLAIDLTDFEKPVAPDDVVEIFGPNNPIDALATGPDNFLRASHGLGGRYNRIYEDN